MKQHLLLFLLFSVLLGSVHSSSPSDYFSASDVTSLKTLVTSHKANDGSYGGSIESTNFAVATLLALSEPPADAKVTCAFAKGFQTPSASVENINHATTVLDLLGCDEKVSAGVINKLVSSLNGSLADKYHAVDALTSIKRNGQGDFNPTALNGVFDAVIDLVEDDGTFRGTESDEDGSPLNAGYAYQILSKLALTETQKQTVVDDVAPLIGDLFSNAEEDYVLVFTESNSLDNLKATSLIFSGVNSLASVIGSDSIEITSDQVVGIAEFLIRHKHVSSLKDAYYLIVGLGTVSSNTFHTPLVLTLPQASIHASKQQTAKSGGSKVKVRVTDIFGKPATETQVYLTKAYPTLNEKEILITSQKAESESSDATLYSFHFLNKPEPGYYSLEFSVTPLDTTSKYFSSTDVVRNIKVVAPIEVADLNVYVTDAGRGDAVDDEMATKYSPVYPGQVESPISINLLQKIVVGFRTKSAVSLKPVKVNQAFVSFTNEETGDQKIYPAKWNNGKYSVEVGLKKNLKDFKGKSGKYALELFVGDPFVQNPVVWKIASLNVNLGSSAKVAGAGVGAAKKPEIYHQFRLPEKRPKAVVSMAFTGAVLSPLLFLIVGLLRGGANLSGIPTGTGFLFAVGFQVCIGAIFGLYAGYWLYLNVVQTIGYLFILGIPTIFFGLKALRSVYQARTRPHKD